MKSRIFTIICAVALTIPAISLAQTSIPADIKAKMNGYVGTWEVKEETRSSPAADPQSVTAKWEARWVFANLIEWRATISSSMGTITNIEYEGYDPVMQGYTNWFDSGGNRGQSFDGTWNGNTIVIQAIEFGPDGSRARIRCTWPYNKDFTAIVNYHCETLTNGSWWVSRTGTATKMK